MDEKLNQKAYIVPGLGDAGDLCFGEKILALVRSMDMIDEAAYVYFLSIFKFIFGPVLGLSYGFGVIWTAALTTLGTLTAAIVFSFFGPQIRVFFSLFFKKKKQKKVFTKRIAGSSRSGINTVLLE